MDPDGRREGSVTTLAGALQELRRRQLDHGSIIIGCGRHHQQETAYVHTAVKVSAAEDCRTPPVVVKGLGCSIDLSSGAGGTV